MRTPKILIVLGKGLESGGRLTYESLVTAAAAAIVPGLPRYEAITNIIFTGGRTAGKHLPSEAQQMFALARQSFCGSVCMEYEGEAIDTRDNAMRVQELLKDRGVFGNPYGLLTWEYHAVRSARAFTHIWKFAPAMVLHSDAIVAEHGVHLEQKAVWRHKQTAEYTRHIRLERLLRLESMFDPGQLLPRVVTKFTRR